MVWVLWLAVCVIFSAASTLLVYVVAVLAITRLNVSVTGVEYFEPGLTIKARWSDLIRLDRTAKGSFPVEARDDLVFSAAEVRGKRWLRIFYRSRLLPSEIHVPIGAFAQPLDGSALAQQVQKFAPALVWAAPPN